MLFYLGTNSKSGKIYLIATMKYTWCAYLSSLLTSINHYDLKKNLTLLPCLFMPLLAVSMITLIMLNHILARFEFQFIYLLYLIFLGFFSSLHDISENLTGVTAFRKLKYLDPSMTHLPAEVKVWLQ